MLDAPESRWTRRCRTGSTRWPISSGAEREGRATGRGRPSTPARRSASTSACCAPPPPHDRPTPSSSERGHRARRSHPATTAIAPYAARGMLPHRDWLAANEPRHRMRLAWAELFTRSTCCSARRRARGVPHDQQASGTSAPWWSTAAVPRSPTISSGPGYSGASVCRRRRRGAGSRRTAFRRRADRRPPVRRPVLPGIRAVARARVAGLRATAGISLTHNHGFQSRAIGNDSAKVRGVRHSPRADITIRQGFTWRALPGGPGRMRAEPTA